MFRASVLQLERALITQFETYEGTWGAYKRCMSTIILVL